MLSNICKKITNRLTAAISKQEDVSVQLEALDILGKIIITNLQSSINDCIEGLFKVKVFRRI